MSTPRAKTMQFRTELKQLLDIIVHSLYSEKEIFLRELVSNAVDAIDKLRFESLTDESVLDGDADWKIQLIPNKEERTLTISDNGVGLSADNIVDTLGTIARSGTQEFIEALRAAKAEDRPDLIGQFGVGFYSSFMVADKVIVISRMANQEAVQWESDGQGKFTIRAAEREKRGTDVILHLKEGEDSFLDEWQLRKIVKKYSDFVEHPIVMEVERTEGEDDDKETVRKLETLNSRKALWLKSPSDVDASEYHEFYTQISHDHEEPLKTIHFAAEGTLEFKSLLFLPKKKPFDWMWQEPKVGLSLYIQRVFIMDDNEELLPSYLRFVKGIVDSSDLPLNVSREMLQNNQTLAKIRKGMVNKILRSLEELSEKEPDDYRAFYAEFGAILKEGVTQDQEHREQLTKLLRFECTATAAGELLSLADYVDKMPPEQEKIYYIIGETREQIANSPYLEAIRAQEQHVLLMTDPVDEFLVNSLTEFEGKQLKAVDRGQLDEGDAASEEEQKELQPLFDALSERIERVKEVRLSKRLRESAACLVADEYGMGAHMERLMKRMGRGEELPPSERVLELNSEHPAVLALRKIFENDPQDPRVEDYGRLLYDQAVLAEGSKVEDPAALARRINALISRAGEA
jgi:molecular chaperone HtpG